MWNHYRMYVRVIIAKLPCVSYKVIFSDRFLPKSIFITVVKETLHLTQLLNT